MRADQLVAQIARCGSGDPDREELGSLPRVHTDMAKVIGARSVLAVRDLRTSTRYYVDVLGFTRDDVDAKGWSFLTKDGFSVMLGECPGERPASELGDHSYVAYLLVEGLDEYYRELVTRGALLGSPPEDKPWGLREFAVRTPDGHRMTCGEPLQQT